MAKLTSVDVAGTRSFLFGGFTGFALNGCYAVGSAAVGLTGPGKAGGFYGEGAPSGSVINCYSSFDISPHGNVFGNGSAKVTNCYYDSTFAGDPLISAGKEIGKIWEELMDAAFADLLGDSFIYVAPEEGYNCYPQQRTMAESGDAAVRADSALSARILADNKFAEGEGTPEKPFRIETAKQLDAVRALLYESFFMINDVDLSGYGNWTPTGTSGAPFTGTFNGGNQTVTGLTITGEGSNTGLFGYAAAPVAIENLGVETSQTGVNGSGDAGILLGHGSGEKNDDNARGATPPTVMSREKWRCTAQRRAYCSSLPPATSPAAMPPECAGYDRLPGGLRPGRWSLPAMRILRLSRQ